MPDDTLFYRRAGANREGGLQNILRLISGILMC